MQPDVQRGGLLIVNQKLMALERQGTFLFLAGDEIRYISNSRQLDSSDLDWVRTNKKIVVDALRSSAGYSESLTGGARIAMPAIESPAELKITLIKRLSEYDWTTAVTP